MTVSHAPVLEITGGVDFEAAASACLDFLENQGG